jgi:1-acyl-sn-glycerol-3-phosphate acyltransferase
MISCTRNNIVKCAGDFIKFLNIDVEVIDKHLDIPINKIYISKHYCYLDSLILCYILQCGFVVGARYKEGFIGSMLNKWPHKLLFIERGSEKQGMVDKMKTHIAKYNKLCIFPEGTTSRDDSLFKFRTGAFHVGVPVQPILLTYKNMPYNDDDCIGMFNNLICQSNKKRVKATVKFLDIIEPTENVKEFTETARKAIGDAGKFRLTRISNRGFKDH